jgi:hypothetical protein
MRPEAVQLERDRLSATIRRPSATDENGNNQCGEEASSAASAQNVPSDSVENFAKNSEAEACLNNLMEAESRMREMRRASVISSSASDAFRTAGIGDVTESMHQQLILMVEWAKVCDHALMHNH